MEKFGTTREGKLNKPHSIISLINNKNSRFSIRHLRDFGWRSQTMEEMILEDAVNLTTVIKTAAKDGIIKNLSQFTQLAVLNSLWSLIGGFR